MKTIDEYHPHYPTVDNDYFQRLSENAHKLANPFRLMCGKYTLEQEQSVWNRWQAAKAQVNNKAQRSAACD